MEEKGMGRRDVAEGPGVEEEEDKNKKIYKERIKI
jgi:hypothetical protein